MAQLTIYLDVTASNIIERDAHGRERRSHG